jgi:hypothetical protein
MMLSPRVLHFTALDMVFQCDTHTVFEGGPDTNDLFPMMNSSKRFVYEEGSSVQKAHYDKWLQIVEEYSRMKLSHQTDRLPAFSGIARIIQRCTGDEYVGGLWKQDLTAGLMWQAVGVNRTSTKWSGLPEYIAPSWSWASLDGVVRTLSPQRRHLLQLEIISVETRLTTTNTLGEISSASLTARGPLKEVSIINANINATEVVKNMLSGEHMRISLAFDTDTEAKANTDRIWCLGCTSITEDNLFIQFPIIRDPHGLLLERLPGPKVVYKRVGVFEVHPIMGLPAEDRRCIHQKDWWQ